MPDVPAAPVPDPVPPKLDVSNLFISYTDRKGVTVQAVQDVSFQLANKPGRRIVFMALGPRTIHIHPNLRDDWTTSARSLCPRPW